MPANLGVVFHQSQWQIVCESRVALKEDRTFCPLAGQSGHDGFGLADNGCLFAEKHGAEPDIGNFGTSVIAYGQAEPWKPQCSLLARESSSHWPPLAFLFCDRNGWCAGQNGFEKACCFAQNNEQQEHTHHPFHHIANAAPLKRSGGRYRLGLYARHSGKERSKGLPFHTFAPHEVLRSSSAVRQPGTQFLRGIRPGGLLVLRNKDVVHKGINFRSHRIAHLQQITMAARQEQVILRPIGAFRIPGKLLGVGCAFHTARTNSPEEVRCVRAEAAHGYSYDSGTSGRAL